MPSEKKHNDDLRKIENMDSQNEKGLKGGNAFFLFLNIFPLPTGRRSQFGYCEMAGCATEGWSTVLFCALHLLQIMYGLDYCVDQVDYAHEAKWGEHGRKYSSIDQHATNPNVTY